MLRYCAMVPKDRLPAYLYGRSWDDGGGRGCGCLHGGGDGYATGSGKGSGYGVGYGDGGNGFGSYDDDFLPSWLVVGDHFVNLAVEVRV